MRINKRVFPIFILILFASIEILAFSPDDPIQEAGSGQPKTGFGMTLMGGSVFSMVKTTDSYFNESILTTRTYLQSSMGLILDFPLWRSGRIWLNPEFMMRFNPESADSNGIKPRLKPSPLISFNITFQQFLSRSFFIAVGGSVCLDDFKYGGVGPSLGLGFKAGKRFSIYSQGRMFYKKLPGSGELINYNAFQVPVSIVVRFDFAPTVKKVKYAETTSIRPTVKTEPVQDNPVEEQKIIPQQKVETVPVNTVEEPKVIQSKSGFMGYSYSDLKIYLEKAIREEDYVKAQKIQDEINRRESSGIFIDIPTGRLEEMLKDALRVEDYNRAGNIQDELNKRTQ
jgi:hypothetical protein